MLYLCPATDYLYKRDIPIFSDRMPYSSFSMRLFAAVVKRQQKTISRNGCLPIFASATA